MSTQILQARNGKITDDMYKIARIEGLEVETIRQKIEQGRMVILKNKQREQLLPVAVGENLSVKVSSAIGIIDNIDTIDSELDKIRVIQEAGADILIDLSRQNINSARHSFLEVSNLPLGSVPFYQTAKETFLDCKNISKISKNNLLYDIEKQCEDGIDFIVIHPGVTKFTISKVENQQTIANMFSKSASVLENWIKVTGNENPLYEYFDEFLDVVKKYDVVLFLSSGLKTNCVSDSISKAQMTETLILGELAKKAREFGVQVVIEAPSHTVINRIPSLIKTVKELVDYTPLYSKGPLVCDCAVGFEYVTSAIGGALASSYGVDFLCANIPFEYLKYTNAAKIKEYIICAKIAAHCADLARGNSKALKQGCQISKAKFESNFDDIIKNSIDKSVFEDFK